MDQTSHTANPAANHTAKQVAIVYNNEENIEGIRFIEDTLQEIFGDYITIDRHYLTHFSGHELISADAILLNGESLLTAIQPHVSDMHNLIVLTKSINRRHLPDLLQIPKGTDVLLVNDTPTTTMDALLMFYKLGILHFNLIPFDPTTPEAYHGIEFAITTGEARLVPGYIRHVIDIGYRKIGFDTLMKLMHTLQLSDELLNQRLIQYLGTVADPYMDSHTNYLESYIKNLILNELSSDSGLAFLAFDASGNLLFENDKAKEVVTAEMIDQLLGAEDERNLLVTIGNSNYLMDRISIGVADQRLGCMVSLKDEKEIRETELYLNKKLREKGVFAKYHFSDIISNTQVMYDCIGMAKKAARTDYTVLLQGESGVGKELFAQSIHNYSSRANCPFLAINCAALPESLLESELFGYEAGSFTGAQKKGKPGLFEQAHTGTLFLDEIGDISSSLQSRLLRVLQEKQIMRIGSDKIIDIDVRIITATNRDLKQMVLEGKFRKDLFYRLSVLPISIPPLRMRKADILPLFRRFAGEDVRRLLTDQQIESMQNYDWPGNVRELENAVIYLKALGTFPPLEQSASQWKEAADPVVAANARQAEPISDPPLSTRDQITFHILYYIHMRTESGVSAGRTQLLQYLHSEGLLLSDSKLRTIMEKLRDTGYLMIPKGRSGPHLTESGEDQLSRLLQSIHTS